MSPEAQRIAIAEACGWTRIWDPAFRQWVQRSHDGKDILCDPDPNSGWEIHRLPDYLNDFNAMHSVEVANDMPFNSEYSWWLGRICTRERGLDPDNVLELDQAKIAHHATAAQRAEAFLKTLNLWTYD